MELRRVTELEIRTETCDYCTAKPHQPCVIQEGLRKGQEMIVHHHARTDRAWERKFGG